MKPIKSLVFIVLVFLFGCQQVLPTPSINTGMPDTQTNTTTPSPLPSKTALPTQTQNPFVHFQCPEIVTGTPKSLKSEQKIVLEDHKDAVELEFFDPVNTTTTMLFEYNMWNGVAVSPNGGIIAYGMYGESSDKVNLALVDVNNNTLKTIAWQDNWNEIVRWANNDQLVLSTYDDEERMMLVTPFKDKVEHIKFDMLGYPDYVSNVLAEPWIEFDPTLERVVYTANDENILLDTNSKEILARVPGANLGTLDVSWSRDGKYVAVVGYAPISLKYFGSAQELYVINRSGEIKQTSLAEYYGAGLQFYRPSWSPDGNYIAFWESDNLENNRDWKLVLFDNNTGQITSFCVSTDYDFYGSYNHGLLAPVWSPDSKQIVVESYHSEDDNGVILIDIINNTAIEIAENASPIGWMVSP